MKFKFILASILALSAAACSSTEEVGTAQQALTQVVQNVAVPSHVGAGVTATDCSNSPGPFITLDGVLTLGSMKVQLVFRNNMKGTHEHVEESVLELTVLQAGETITIPKQPVLGGVGGNPWILVQLVDGNGNALSPETLLGRCVQGLNNVDLLLGSPGLADAWLTELSCSNNPGPYINVDGVLTMDGVKVRIIFRNNLQGTHETDVVQDLTVLQSGTSFEFPKQPPLGGVGGNPHIFLRFVDQDGNLLGEETYLGRCNQLSKSL